MEAVPTPTTRAGLYAARRASGGGVGAAAAAAPLFFQAVSWHAEDSESGAAAEEQGDSSDDDDDAKGGSGCSTRRYAVKVFGVDELGTSVSLTVRGFTPFFYVRLLDVQSKKPVSDASLLRAAEKRLADDGKRHDMVGGADGVRCFGKKDFWGFTQGEVFQFLRLSFRTLRGMRIMAAMLRKQPLLTVGGGRRVEVQQYESNMDPLLRMFHLLDVAPAGWLRVDRHRALGPGDPTSSTCEVDAECSWRDLRPAARDELAPLLVAAFDIECNSAHGDFPVAIKDYRRLAIDLQELYERGGVQQSTTDYDATVVLQDAMRDAFGLPTRPPRGQPPLAAPRAARLQHKRALGDADRAAIEELIKQRIDDVLLCLRFAPPPAPPLAPGAAPGDAECAVANPALAKLLAFLNNMFARKWPLRGDEVIQIGMTLNIYGERECCARYVFALGGCEPVPGALTRAFQDEGSMLRDWVALVRALDPDVIAGYNINGFDQAYLFDRAKELFGGETEPGSGVVAAFSNLGRFASQPSKFEEQKLASSALGDNVLRYIDMQGRVIVDVMKVVQRDHKLDSYKLDAVAQHFTGEAKHDVSPQASAEKRSARPAGGRHKARSTPAPCACSPAGHLQAAARLGRGQARHRRVLCAGGA